MCDMGTECQASDRPITTGIPCLDYNAVVDDYDFWVNEKWIDGLDYIKNWHKYEHKNKLTDEQMRELADRFFPDCYYIEGNYLNIDGSITPDDIVRAADWIKSLENTKQTYGM